MVTEPRSERRARSNWPGGSGGQRTGQRMPGAGRGDELLCLKGFVCASPGLSVIVTSASVAKRFNKHCRSWVAVRCAVVGAYVALPVELGNLNSGLSIAGKSVILIARRHVCSHKTQELNEGPFHDKRVTRERILF